MDENKEKWRVVLAAEAQLEQVTDLALALWPASVRTVLRQEMAEILADEEAAVFLLLVGDEAAAFAQVGRRQDYVEGTDSQPVGYLEGIYVRPERRRQGLAKRLLEACEAWVRKMGCTEMGSDCALDNRDSETFHLQTGFREAGRIICFVKKL